MLLVCCVVRARQHVVQVASERRHLADFSVDRLAALVLSVNPCLRRCLMLNGLAERLEWALAIECSREAGHLADIWRLSTAFWAEHAANARAERHVVSLCHLHGLFALCQA